MKTTAPPRPSNRSRERVDPLDDALGIVPRRVRAEEADLHVDHEERGPGMRKAGAPGSIMACSLP